MKYEKGSIVLKSGTVFDDGNVDPKPCHPTLIPIGRNNVTEEVYYLIITSQIGEYARHEKEYYMIDGDMVKTAHLVVPSMINLKEIYKTKEFINTVGCLTPGMYKKAIQKFEAYQAEHPHRYYDEVRNLI